MLKKRFLICLALLAALLVANLAMIQAASSSDLTYTLNDAGDGYVVTDCASTASGSLSIPSTYSGKPVVEIGRDAFLDCTGLTSVTIPTSVKTIGWYAFSGCTGLTSIKIPDSVTTLDWFAFSDCTGLTSVTVGNGVTCIDASAFAGCTKLTTVTLGNGVTSIGWSAFKGCTKLSSINIPGGVTSIDRYAFYNCSSLSSVTYCGTSQEWRAITKGEGNDALSGVTVTYHKYTNCVCSLCQDSQHSPAEAVKENEKAATCATAGSYDSVVYCSSCNAEISRNTISIPTTSHTEVIDEAIAPTCTESGLTEGKHCSVCNEVLVARTVVDALGHTEEIVAGKAATCTEAGRTDGVICSVCGVTITEQTEIPATGHTYVDGTCACGATEVLTDSELVLVRPNTSGGDLMLGDDIRASFIVNAKSLSYDEIYLEIVKDGVTTNVYKNDTSTSTLFRYTYVVPAAHMTMDIQITVYGVKDGVTYRGEVLNFSIRKCVEAKMAAWINNSAAAAQCKLLMNMLYYGEQAQLQFGVNTDNLATTGLPQEYLDLITSDVPTMGTLPTISASGKITKIAHGLQLQEKVKLSTVLTSSTAFTDYSKVTIEVKHHRSKQGDVVTYTYASSDIEFVNSKNIRFYFDKVAPSQMRDELEITVYEDGVAVSATYVRSMDMVCNQTNYINNMPDLIYAIMNYADAAKAVFG